MSTNNPSKEEILQTLPNFYGTENYHRWSAMFPNFVLTDGAKYIAESCGAYWLMGAIASHRASYRNESFVVAVLGKVSDFHGNGFYLSICDDIPSNKMFASQRIQFSDFPLDEIKMYLVKQGDLWVIMLPSEY